jgi:hypothetical protein
LNNQNKKLGDSENQLTNETKILEEVENQLTNITKVISGFQTPIGSLAIGFDYLVLISPIALVNGFVICISVLVEAMRIRKDYVNFYEKINRSGHDITSKDIVISAPLWIDPENPEQNKIGRFAILLIPFAIFVASCSLIFYSWLNIPIAESTLGGNPIYRPVYAGTYIILGGLLFFYSCRKIVITSRLYKNNLNKITSK